MLPLSLPSARFEIKANECFARGQGRQLLADAEVEEGLQKVPAPLRRALMPFQREGVMFGLARRGRVLIADEMGEYLYFLNCSLTY